MWTWRRQFQPAISWKASIAAVVVLPIGFLAAPMLSGQDQGSQSQQVPSESESSSKVAELVAQFEALEGIPQVGPPARRTAAAATASFITRVETDPVSTDAKPDKANSAAKRFIGQAELQGLPHLPVNFHQRRMATASTETIAAEAGPQGLPLPNGELLDLPLPVVIEDSTGFLQGGDTGSPLPSDSQSTALVDSPATTSAFGLPSEIEFPEQLPGQFDARGSMRRNESTTGRPWSPLPAVEPVQAVPHSSDLGQMSLQQLESQVASQRILGEYQPYEVDLPTVLSLALIHSRSIQVSRIQPAEALQEVNQQYGAFDWRGFVEGLFRQDAQPVSVVGQTTLNNGQVRNDQHGVSFGVRKLTRSGGEFEISERLGVTDSNSGLLNPDQPGDARVAVTFSQELLRDGGRDVVLNQALIASLRADIQHTDSFAEISNRLQAVYAQYWDLYQKRGDYFIQVSLSRWAETTLQQLESRGLFDAEQNSIEQARALLREALANAERARAAVMISQDRLYRLVNAPELDSNFVELVTVQSPRPGARIYDVPSELEEALQFRAEVRGKILEIRSAAVTHHVSLNQLLPKLTFFIESSLNGIDANLDYWDAQRKMFDVDPSYGAGLNFEIFLANRTAKAQNKRAQLALRRLQLEYEDLLQQVRLEVATAIRTLNASTKILEERRKTLEARQDEIESLRRRKELVAQQGVSPALVLEQFFQAINRLVVSQREYIGAVRDQQAAQADLLLAKGLLLNISEVPRDQDVFVPSINRAFQERRENRVEYLDETHRRVVQPGRNPLPVLK